MIQEYDIVFSLLIKYYSLISADGCIYLHLGAFKQVFENGKVDLGIVHCQNPCLRRRKGLLIFLSFQNRISEGFLVISYRCPVLYNLNKLEGECGSLSVFAFHLYVTAHHIEKALCNAHTETCTFDISVLTLFYTFKGHKQFLHILRLNAYAGIRNTYQESYGFRTFFFKTGFKGDGSFLCIFYRI